MARYQVEVTDTFGGEANYSWVRRYVVEGPMDVGTRADRKLVRDAKKAASWSGRTVTSDMGDMIEVRPRSRNVCQVMFITYIDTSMDSEPDLSIDELT